MNTFYLIRHGQKTSQTGDPSLTSLGRSQSEKTGKFLLTRNISKIFSSTYKRTSETANIINNLLGVEIEHDDRLRERMNWGSVKGQALEEFLKEWEYSDLNRNFKPKAGISSQKVAKLVSDLLNEILVKFPNKNIAIITSGPTIVDFLRDLLTDAELEELKPGILRDKLPECSITYLQANPSHFIVKEVGYTEHLA